MHFELDDGNLGVRDHNYRRRRQPTAVALEGAG